MAKKKNKSNEGMPGFSKKFFSNDLIERFIRIEQNVSSSFGEKIPYKDTEYYKSLSDKEKKDFEKYLKKKGKMKKFLSYLLILPVLAFLVFGVGPGITGGAVGASDSAGSLGIVGWISLGLVGFGLAIFTASNSIEKRKDKRFEKHLDIIDNLLSQRYSMRKSF